MAQTGAILGDITVLDLSQGIPGPYCSKLLAALGARVIKVEPPAGDRGRLLGPFKDDLPHPETSGAFLYLNTARQSITLNLATTTGQDLLRRLLARTDVLIEDFAPGTLASWGFSDEALGSTNPRLVVASITPFGQDGPYHDWLSSEIVAEALGGLMYTVGLPEREPLKIGGNPVLYNAGGAAFAAIMAALFQRDTIGAGQIIDISIHEATAFAQIHCSIQATWHGTSPTRRPNTMIPARDGWVSVGLEMGVAADIWPRICDLIDRPDLIDDPRFATVFARRDNREALNDVVSDWVRTQSKEAVYHRLQAMRTIAGYVATTEDLYHNEQFEARGFFDTIDHPVAGTARYPGLPFAIGDAPVVRGRAPLLGEHNVAVYRDELGISADDLVRLHAGGVI